MSDQLFSDKALPEFSKININNIQPTIKDIIKNNKNKLVALKQDSDLKKFILALEEMDLQLSNAWSPVSHMNSVISSKELRAAYEQALQDIIQYNLSVGQDDDIYSVYKKFIEQHSAHVADNYILKLSTDKIRDFKLAGVELSDQDKEKYKELVSELSKHTTRFSNNVMDCTDAWTYHINDKDMLSGIPQNIIEQASKRAQDENKQGYLFGLDAPTYLAILKNADNRELRAAFHFAYATRASKKGPHEEKYDNTSEMYNILLKRHQKAKLLGYSNYTEYSLATKMVNNPQEVIDFLTSLMDKAKVYAQKEWDELKLFASRKDNCENLQPWDVSYYSELQKNKLFNLSDEVLKEYFPLAKVMSGLFKILNEIYGISFEENLSADTWHQDVFCYNVLDQEQKVIGYIYLDLFARLHKRNGAWMDECRIKSETGNLNQLPVAYLTCNFSKSVDEKPSLLTHYDVVTLFHEFGHCLHHLLTKINYPSISGINGVPWDAVELPSQIHENWCWQHDSLPLISEHYASHESLPDKYLNQLQKQKNYQAGLFLLRQITFALFDFKLHLEFHPDKGVGQIQDVIKQVRENIEVLNYAEYDQFQHSFSHIFAGGYAAGYYSYLWADVLAANCFKKFEQDGIFNSATGQKFLDDILSCGGSIDFNDAVTKFCGKEIAIEPLLEKYGVS